MFVHCISDKRIDSASGYIKFYQNVATGTTFVQPGSLQPISATAAYHSLTVYLQVQQLKRELLQPEDFGVKADRWEKLPIPNGHVTSTQVYLGGY